MAELFSRPGRDDPLSAAQDIMYRAWDATAARERIALARKALKTSPLCADAYVLLAEDAARTPADASTYYEQGVEAGEAAIGPDGFREYAGHFWGFLETRPYMRARQGLAVTLWTLGRHQEAVMHCQAMLELNPQDNQGIRYLLAAYLLQLGLVDPLKKLLEQFDEDGAAMWLYTRALLAFRETDPNADRLAADAWSANSYVPDMLSGRRPLIGSQDGYITMGGEDEAGEYVSSNGPAWHATPGAIDWVTRVTQNLAPKPGQRPPR